MKKMGLPVRTAPKMMLLYVPAFKGFLFQQGFKPSVGDPGQLCQNIVGIFLPHEKGEGHGGGELAPEQLHGQGAQGVAFRWL